ncbi:cytochrome P450 monooxygenase pc-3 [Guyanagaster necrorhizus]|uniref:Cytochrome P450 monooxygenase pc-3 n=1 Tax=Guyanagaster necrorhizus TaxID=856835 RepID=A0A9P7VPS3_9AGAR|nr:cytochrome P450 monooxygenase pc-3 [Guyanagaster necrorhizus MCA 3950]KAG7443774.1 cytochrome P450 monooxygenase pc-3 [Guyanagaster necrorhizus MCA 3950]
MSALIYWAFRVVYADHCDKKDAGSMGARLVPRAQGRWPGNIDILAKSMYVWAEGYPSDGFDEMIDAHGSIFNLRMLWSDMVFTTSPKHIQQILATEFENFEKGQRFQYAMKSVLGVGVFNADGKLWKFHRSMTRPFFTRDRITHFDLYDRHADAAISQMKRRLRSGYAVEFQDLMGRFTMDSATDFLFGSCVNSLSATLPYPHGASLILAESDNTRRNEANVFAEAFLKAQRTLANRIRQGGIWPLFEITNDETETPMKIVHGFVEPIIDAALRKQKISVSKKKDLSEIGDDETLLDHLVSMTSDQVVIRDETLNILLAARDTTAATLTLIVYFLSMYPDTCSRLREEILRRVGPNRMPTFEDIKEMKYLRAVINETLRLYPIVPFNVRDSINATTFPSDNPSEKPLYIPAHTTILYSVFLMHRRKDLWGPDAEEFDPNRFLDHRLKKYLTPHPFIFLPFNAGPRICLGQQFAYNEISFMLVRLLQTFSSFKFCGEALPNECRTPADWTKCNGRKAVDKFWPRSTLTLYSAGGLWIKATEADRA